ncbi:putative mitochondrial proline oxidase, mitochondrial precursor-like protein [Leptomonas pyrrhocoris]|uniref:Proline dehydrogenase n=1 Tax=Leptomonas pyrrhocoris TaxID=157538 RepID=A0A0M9GBD9_LEPPY|nr:putative mitochondrial proline oxidase, mitochondrial precursor-like protein [Leptomonas pyrrhocoris]KPA86950.1 putative mitochondrial proline oxidase, mitochondrial precursor-like protein [Leptomonas pyrrhocoris]|eukprot:XP_015665389.1 putative mitochondrial proline oxidase, mitochondrial precursor-like protein [Leptomonas pyrrhocoris]
MRRFFLPAPTVSALALSARCATMKARNSQAPCVPDFNDDTTYRQRSTWYLVKALILLRLCGVNYLATNSVQVMKKFEKALGTKLTYNILVKKSFYNYFCAGENDQEVRETIDKMAKTNVGAVLDYAAEADTEGFAPEPGLAVGPEICMSRLVTKCNVEYPMSESTFDQNMKLYMMCIMHASLYSPCDAAGVAAVKVTGMCDPQLLARVSAILMSVHQSWSKHFTGENETVKLEECRVVMGLHRKHQLFVTYEQLRAGFDKYNPSNKLTDEQFKEIAKALDRRNVGKVNYFEYKEMLTEALIALEPTPVQKALIEGLPQMSSKEKELWKNVNNRLGLIAQTARVLNVRMLVDAEQTFYQVAIDAIVASLQREYNKEVPVVYNTYQCYLTYAQDRIDNDLVRARHMDFHWGGKIVRGAYMIQERASAEKDSYTSPIWPTIEETHKCYNAAAEQILKKFEKEPNKKHEVFFGTHNKESLEVITALVLQHPDVQSRVFFGQLFGMRDNLTVPLAKAGFHVYKYLPYGPVRETIHYLGRRAVENASILTNGGNCETVMMKNELKRRCGLRQKKH